jgi:hypothetical protein
MPTIVQQRFSSIGSEEIGTSGGAHAGASSS